MNLGKEVKKAIDLRNNSTLFFTFLESFISFVHSDSSNLSDARQRVCRPIKVAIFKSVVKHLDHSDILKMTTSSLFFQSCSFSSNNCCMVLVNSRINLGDIKDCETNFLIL